MNVYMTVLSSKDYIPGVKALKKSLVKVKSQYKLVVLVPQDAEELFSTLLKEKRIIDDMCLV